MTLSTLPAGPAFAATLFPGMHEESSAPAGNPRKAKTRSGRQSVQSASSPTLESRRYDEDAERWDGLS